MIGKGKLIYIALFSFCLLFLFMGYATLTDELNIDGTVTGTPQENVFITDVVTGNGDKVTLKGFYGTLLNQSITLTPGQTASYRVNLYNNNPTTQYILEEYICENLPEGVTIEVKEYLGDEPTTNVISSLIDADDNDSDALKNEDFFSVTYTYNGSAESVTIDSPFKFKYVPLTDQLQIALKFGNEVYVKYAPKQETVEGVTSYSDVTFDQINIPVNNTVNRVARCDNGAILSTEAVDENNVNLKVSNIKKTGIVAGGTLGVKCKVYSSLTSAAKEDASLAQLTPNNFILLQNIDDTIESTTESIVVNKAWDYSFNLNSKTIEVHRTIKNEGILKVYDSNKTKGTLKKKYSTSENLSNEYYDKLAIKIVTNSDLIHNIWDDSFLYIENVILNLDDTDTYDDYIARVDDSKIANNEYKFEYPAIVVGFEGLVKILNSELYSDYAYGVYKKSYYAGDYKNRLLNPTSDESKILVESSRIVCDYNNCVRFSDGKGIISLVDSYISTNANVGYSLDGRYKTDPIFASKHPLEGFSSRAGSSSYATNPEYIKTLYSRFYRYSTTDMKIFVTGGTIVTNRIKSATEQYGHVNHFYSANELNARLFYTKSVKFMSVQRTGGSSQAVLESDCAASTNDQTFKYVVKGTDANGNSVVIREINYPIAMLNGNSAVMKLSDLGSGVDTTGIIPLFNNDGTLNRNHYLNNDGWYYIKKTTTGATPIKKGNTIEYNTTNYINSAKYDNLTHLGDYVRVGDAFELINFNNPTEFYVDLLGYDNSTSYYAGLKNINSSKGETQADFVGLKYEFTFLVSGDQNYYNIVSLGNLNGVLHIENYSVDAPKNFNVGIKYIDTNVTSVNMDQIEQRFTIMFYNHEEIANAQTKVNPYVFVSKFNSVLSYISAKDDKDFDSGTNASVTKPHFREQATTFNNYLLSNVSSPTYIRNGWYLWQDEIAVYNEVDLTDLIVNGVVDKGDYTVKLSKHTEITENGIILHSDNTDGVGEATGGNGVLNDYGWIRITTDKEFYGIQFTVKNYNPNDLPITNTPWLFIRTYNTAGDYIVYDIEKSNAVFGIWRPIIDGEVQYDYDENRKYNSPYYVITSGNTADEQVITIYFDCKYTNWDLHSITLQPFYDAAKINTMIITSIELIEPMEAKH